MGVCPKRSKLKLNGTYCHNKMFLKLVDLEINADCTFHFMCLAFVLIKKAFFLVDLALYDVIDSHAPGLHARVYQNNFQELLLSFCHGFQGSSSSCHMYVASIVTHQIISVPLELTFTIIVTVNSLFLIILKTCF